MSSRERAIDRAAAKSVRQLDDCLSSIRNARLAADLSLDDAAGVAGFSPSQFSRAERGLVRGLSIHALARMASVVGLDLSIRTYPGGAPIRDAAHLKLLADFRSHLSVDLRWATEVPMPNTGDPRAWDGLVGGSGFRVGVEAETRIRDAQAVTRRITLKKRDSGVEHAILLVRDTRWNRDVLRAAQILLDGSFPVPGRVALRALALGHDPGGDALILI